MILHLQWRCHAATFTSCRGRRRATARKAVGGHTDGGLTQRPPDVQGISDSISMDLQADESAAPSVRLRNMSSGLIAQMQKEAGEKLTLQQQLLKSQQDVMDALTREEAAYEERSALQARTDRLAATLSMMEHRSSELQAELEAVQHSRQTLAEAREALMAEKNALIEQLQQQQKDLESANSMRAATSAALQLEVESNKAEVTALQERLAQTSVQQASLSTDMDTTRAAAEAAQKDRDAAQTELSKLRAELQESQKGQTDSKEASEHLRTQLQQAQTSLAEQSAALQAAQQSAASAQAQLSAQADAAAAEKQRADAADATVAALRSEITSASDRAAFAEAALQTQTKAAAAANKRAAAAEEELGRQIVAAQEALARSEAAERALREQREEAAVRAAAMDKELRDARHKLSTTESYLAKRMAVVASLPRRARGGRKNRKAVEKSKEGEALTAQDNQAEEGLPGVGHTNMNRYSLGSPDMLFDFTKALAKREASLQSVPGYLGMTMNQTQPQEFEVQTLWESAEAFENWSYDRHAQQQAGEMPLGVFQRTPRKGEGVPDGYTPIKSD